MIVAYVRPFSGNRGSKTMLAALPERFLSGFAPDERALPQVVMKDRNELLAHSDHSAWRLRLSVIRSPGRSPMLVPLHRDTVAPLGTLNAPGSMRVQGSFAAASNRSALVRTGSSPDPAHRSDRPVLRERAGSRWHLPRLSLRFGRCECDCHHGQQTTSRLYRHAGCSWDRRLDTASPLLP
jgi:hypothetical protein